MVAGGLVWYDAMIAIIIGHLIGSFLTVWNGRGGSVYHIGVREPDFICYDS
jgi:NCS1 family nucleobase:cation symporter-1